MKPTYFTRASAAGIPFTFVKELFDPPPFRCDQPGNMCRFSEASFAKYSSNITTVASWVDLIGKILQVDDANTGSVNLHLDDPRVFSITEVASWHVMGQLLDKVGPQTGWTTGRVIATDKTQVFGGVSLLQQVEVIGKADEPVAARGDSGAPVFFRCGAERGPNVRLGWHAGRREYSRKHLFVLPAKRHRKRSWQVTGVRRRRAIALSLRGARATWRHARL